MRNPENSLDTPGGDPINYALIEAHLFIDQIAHNIYYVKLSVYLGFKMGQVCQ